LKVAQKHGKQSVVEILKKKQPSWFSSWFGTSEVVQPSARQPSQHSETNIVQQNTEMRQTANKCRHSLLFFFFFFFTKPRDLNTS
jgi:hypothetical protein